MSVAPKLKQAPPPPPPDAIPVAPLSANTSLNQDVDGLLGGFAWYPGRPDHTNVTYSFQGFADAEKIAIGSILAQVSSFANISFEEKPGSNEAAAQMRLRETHTQGADGFAYYPGSGKGGDATFDNRGGSSGLVRHDAANLQPGDYTFTLFMHELGHALGLKHPFENSSFGIVPPGTDSIERTVMSYDAFVGANNTWATDGNNPQTYMMFDIAALQYMYGANYSTNDDDTTYKWNASGALSINSGSFVDAAPDTDTVFMTIWDGSGNDTYDFSNYGTNLSVDLRPGGWTTLDPDSHHQLANLAAHAGDPAVWAAGNIANALVFSFNQGASGAGIIENATGGGGADTIVGNDSDNILIGGGGSDTLNGGPGADRITGGLGADQMTGGPGADRFYFAQGQVNGDLITDFGAGDAMYFAGFAVGATLTHGSGDSWSVNDGAHAAEIMHLTGVAALAAGTDYFFV